MGWLIAAAALVLGGLYLYGRGAVAAASGLPQMVPPGPTGFLAVITDPNQIKQYQSIVAGVVADHEPGGLAGLHIADYNAGDVDGNAHNPRWIAALSALQRYVNADQAAAAAMAGYTAAPVTPGFPDQLRTDGVLDYATAIVIVNG